MFSNLTDRAQQQLSNGLPFVIYSRPKQATITALFQNDDAVRTLSDFTETGFVLAPYDVGNPTIVLRPDERLETVDYPTVLSLDAAASKLKIVGSQKDFHRALVEKAVSLLQAGELQKVVVSRCLEVPLNTSPIHLLKRLLATYPAAYCYLWYHPKVGCWLGATPEILLRVQNNRFTTMSLAGTQPYAPGKPPEWGLKELEEQQLVTEYIKRRLRTKTAHLEIKDRENFRAGNLWHLRTKIEGSVQDTLANLVAALHPTPAVCGVPVQKAQEFIAAHEGYNRSFYTGYLGEINRKTERNRTNSRKNIEHTVFRSVTTASELFVNLRCMQIVDEKAHIYVGGGITAASDPEKEWQETVNKSMTMLRVLQDD